MNWLVTFMQIVTVVGQRAELTWPHIKLMATELQHILQIVNDGKPIAHGEIKLTPEGDALVAKLKTLGASEAEALQVAQLATMANDRLA